MTISRGRSINVDGRDYTWVVKDRRDTILRVQDADGSGSVLYVNFGYPSLTTPVAITPARVKELIVEALDQGWEPTEQHPPDFPVICNRRIREIIDSCQVSETGSTP